MFRKDVLVGLDAGRDMCKSKMAFLEVFQGRLQGNNMNRGTPEGLEV